MLVLAHAMRTAKPPDVFTHMPNSRRVRFTRLWLVRTAIVAFLVFAPGSYLTPMAAFEMSLYRTMSGAEMPSFQIGRWYGYVLVDIQPGGYFVGCSIRTDYPNEIVLRIVRQFLGRVQVIVTNESWWLSEGDRFPIAISVDDIWLEEILAEAAFAQGIMFDLDPEGGGLSALRKANQLTISAARATYEFDLEGIEKAFVEFDECYERWFPEYCKKLAELNPFSAETVPACKE